MIASTDDTFTVQLSFVPHIEGSYEDREFYIYDKENKCVVCGAKDTFHRFHIVPALYRTHFPDQLKA